MTDYRRILIIKPSSFGDIVHAWPTLQALRRHFPAAHIAWLVKRQWAGLLTRVEGLDAVWSVEPTGRGWLSEIPRLRAAKFDLAVDLQGLFRSAAIGWLAGCRTRIGLAHAREGAPLFYTHRVPVPHEVTHVVDQYLLVAAALGADGGSPEPAAGRREFGLRLQARDRAEVAALLGRRGLPEGTPWVAVNVGARWPSKRYPVELFAAALDVIQETVGPVGIIGGPDEREDARAVARVMRTAPVDLTGTVSLELLPALLESASAVISGDSGPMHLAAAVGTPVVGLFGPSSPAYSGPRGDRHRTLKSEVPCSPCFSVVCRNAVHLECLHRITPDRIVEAVRDALRAYESAVVPAEAGAQGLPLRGCGGSSGFPPPRE